MRIIATVPPHLKHYKQFQKTSPRFFMPCQTAAELLTIGNHFRKGTSARDLFSDEKSIIRIHEMGPFLQYVLPESPILLSDYEANRQEAVKCMNVRDIVRLCAIESGNKYVTNVSHWFLMYAVNRNHNLPYGTGSV